MADNYKPRWTKESTLVQLSQYWWSGNITPDNYREQFPADTLLPTLEVGSIDQDLTCVFERGRVFAVWTGPTHPYRADEDGSIHGVSALFEQAEITYRQYLFPRDAVAENALMIATFDSITSFEASKPLSLLESVGGSHLTAVMVTDGSTVKERKNQLDILLSKLFRPGLDTTLFGYKIEPGNCLTITDKELDYQESQNPGLKPYSTPIRQSFGLSM